MYGGSTFPNEVQLNLFQVIGTALTYPTSTMYYVTTKSGSSNLDLTRYPGGSISAITISNGVPSGCTLVAFASFDNGTTWWYKSGGTWTSIALSDTNLTAHGMAISALQTALTDSFSNFPTSPAQSSLAFAFGLETTTNTNTPTVTGISVTFQPAVSYEQSSVSKTGGTGDFAVRIVDSTHILLINQSGGSKTIVANAATT
jgi:hypothetical protein